MASRLITFTPAEASAVSGWTTTMQRDLRRRGFYPPASEYTAFTLMEMRLDKLLSDGGLGPGAGSRLWRRSIAYTVVSRALMSPDAYAADVRPSHQVIEPIRLALIDQVVGEDSVYTGEHLPAGSKPKILQCPRFAVWWGDKAASAGDSLDSLHAARADRGVPTLPALSLDLHGAASDLLREAGYLVQLEN